MSRRRARGFTLVELMVVVSITAVMASLAVVAMRRTRTEEDVDQFANAVRTAMIQARRRAVATRLTYMVDLRARSVRWCQVDPATVTANVTTQTTCPPAASTIETGLLVGAGSDAQADFYSAKADVVVPGVAYAAATQTAMPSGGVPLYFGALGTCDSTYAGAAAGVPPLPGFTVYLEPQNSTAGDAAKRRRRLVIYGVSARPRIVDNW